MNAVRWVKKRYLGWRTYLWIRSPTFLLEGGRRVKMRNGLIADQRLLLEPGGVGEVDVPPFIKRQSFWILICAMLVVYWSRQKRERLAVVRKERAARRADVFFGWIEVIVPRRLANEQIGDALEKIHGWENDPRCKHVPARIYLKMVTTAVWVFADAFRCVVGE